MSRRASTIVACASNFAATFAGASSLTIECQQSRIDFRLRSRYLDEQASDLDSDVFITWVDSPENVEVIAEDKLLSQIPALAGGHWYAETDMEKTMASTNPTPLSIPVIVSDFVPDIVKAIEGA